MSKSKHVFSTCLLLTALVSAHGFAETTFNYHGGAGIAVLPGPHAITSMTRDSGPSNMNYDANGDLIEVTGDMTLCQDYSAIRKPRRHSQEARDAEGTCSESTSVDILYTTTGEKLAVLSEGTLDVFMGDGVRITGGKTRISYSGDVEESESGELHYRAKDHLGSIVAVANKQRILQRLDYLPYGEVWYSDIDGFSDREFNGNFKQGDLLDYNARHYHPVLGKFIQADSIVPKVDTVGFNRYAYVSNNPLNRIDPSGHNDELVYMSQLPEGTNVSFNIKRMQEGLYHARYSFDVDGTVAHRGDVFLTRGNAMFGHMETAPEFQRMGFSGAAHELVEMRVRGIYQWNQREWVGTNEALIKLFGFPSKHLVMDRLGYVGYVSHDRSYWTWVKPGTEDELRIIMSEMYQELPENPRAIVARAAEAADATSDVARSGRVVSGLKAAGKNGGKLLGWVGAGFMLAMAYDSWIGGDRAMAAALAFDALNPLPTVDGASDILNSTRHPEELEAYREQWIERNGIPNAGFGSR